MRWKLQHKPRGAAELYLGMGCACEWLETPSKQFQLRFDYFAEHSFVLLFLAPIVTNSAETRPVGTSLPRSD